MVLCNIQNVVRKWRGLNVYLNVLKRYLPGRGEAAGKNLVLVLGETKPMCCLSAIHSCMYHGIPSPTLLLPVRVLVITVQSTWKQMRARNKASSLVLWDVTKLDYCPCLIMCAVLKPRERRPCSKVGRHPCATDGWTTEWSKQSHQPPSTTYWDSLTENAGNILRPC